MSEGKTDLTEPLGFVSASEYRKKVATALLGPVEKTVARISDESGMSQPHVSKTIKELKKKGLVKCLNPDQRKGKLHSLTARGERVGSRLSVWDNFSGLGLKGARALDAASIPYARNLELGPKNHKATADFAILDALELKAVVMVEPLAGDFLKDLRESAFLVEAWKGDRDGLRSMLVVGGATKEEAAKSLEYFIEGGFFDSILHEDDLECIREKELGLEEILGVEEHCADWSAG